MRLFEVANFAARECSGTPRAVLAANRALVRESTCRPAVQLQSRPNGPRRPHTGNFARSQPVMGRADDALGSGLLCAPGGSAGAALSVDRLLRQPRARQPDSRV